MVHKIAFIQTLTPGSRTSAEQGGGQRNENE